MEFNFLPKLPKSNLDDRTYQELIEECLLRIPRYCPEWTNYNPSDPGITLIELFAWLTDQMLLRFNQVPLRHYIAFLELLGIRLKPPQPATGEVTFYLITTLSDPYTIPSYTEVATPRSETEEAVIFNTVSDLTIGNPQIRHFLSASNTEISSILTDRFSQFWDRQITGEWNGPALTVFDDPPQPGNCYYIILESNPFMAGNVIALTFKG
ncbi:MAG TPA: putative baseplate assembly protein, partial [Cyanothece sp. UBA12306]|nr:putative baseplate assembly protein [Cyanothece sp. UBA12306]